MDGSKKRPHIVTDNKPNKPKYPEKLIDSAINRLQHPPDQVTTPSDSPVRIIMLYKDQKSADAVCRQLCDLGVKINQQLLSALTSKKIADHLRVSFLFFNL